MACAEYLCEIVILHCKSHVRRKSLRGAPGSCGAAWGVQTEGLPPGWGGCEREHCGPKGWRGRGGGFVLWGLGDPSALLQEERIALRLAGWKISIRSLPTRDTRWLPVPWHEVGPADGLQCWDAALCQLGHVYPTARICADILPERGTRRRLPKYGQHFLKGDRGWDAGQGDRGWDAGQS